MRYDFTWEQANTSRDAPSMALDAAQIAMELISLVPLVLSLVHACRVRFI